MRCVGLAGATAVRMDSQAENYPVIARSPCDEAIQLLLAALDCFAALAMMWRVCTRHSPRHCRAALATMQ
jgi:hypothetical protein